MFPGHNKPVECLSWSPTGMLLATASGDETVKLWCKRESSSALEMIRTLTGHTDTVTSLVFTSEDEIVSGSHDCTVRLWLKTNEGIWKLN